MSGVVPIPPRGIARRIAVFLDFDGTLVEIAPRPDAIVVPLGLSRLLGDLAQATGGATALLSGRPISDLDRWLAPLRLAAAGCHGAELRRRPDGPAEPAAAPCCPDRWLELATRLAARHPGALVERKPFGFALHARACPGALPELRDALAALVAEDRRFRLLHAHMAVEVLPRGVHKGAALAALLDQPPFAGRVPIAIGDDVTDEDALAEARARGGHGYRVGESFRDPGAVRAWLAAVAREAGHAPAA